MQGDFYLPLRKRGDSFFFTLFQNKMTSRCINSTLMEKVVVAKFANTTPHGAIKGKKQTHEKEYFSIVKEYLTVKRVFQLVHFLHRFNRKVIEAFFVKYIFQEDEHERENNVHYLHVNGVKKLVHFFAYQSFFLFPS